jgi:hypothetical protein
MDVKIETSRLTLRPWGEEDIEQLTLGLNDLKLAKWLAFVPHPYSTLHAKIGSGDVGRFRTQAFGRLRTNLRSNFDLSDW